MYHRNRTKSLSKANFDFFQNSDYSSAAKNSFLPYYKHFEDSRFLQYLSSTDFLTAIDDPNENYNFITEKFLNVDNQTWTIKNETLRGNQALFMTKN